MAMSRTLGNTLSNKVRDERRSAIKKCDVLNGSDRRPHVPLFRNPTRNSLINSAMGDAAHQTIHELTVEI
jgi:hypothetical protein